MPWARIQSTLDFWQPILFVLYFSALGGIFLRARQTDKEAATTWRD